MRQYADSGDAFDRPETDIGRAISPDDPLAKWLQDPASAEFFLQKAREHLKGLGMDIPDNGAGKSNFAEEFDNGGQGLPANASDPINGRTPSRIATPTPPSASAVPISDGSPPVQLPNRGVTPAPDIRADDPNAGTPNHGFFKNIGVALGLRDPKTGEIFKPKDTTPFAAADAMSGMGSGEGPDRINPLDPEPNPRPFVGTPTPMADPRKIPGESSSTDVSAKKKDSDGGASDFMKMMSALKPIAPPPLSAVGTPSVRSPTAVNAPNIAQLLQVAGAHTKPDPMMTLGRLLVAGKS